MSSKCVNSSITRSRFFTHCRDDRDLRRALFKKKLPNVEEWLGSISYLTHYKVQRMSGRHDWAVSFHTGKLQRDQQSRPTGLAFSKMIALALARLSGGPCDFSSQHLPDPIPATEHDGPVVGRSIEFLTQRTTCPSVLSKKTTSQIIC
jgi:hypothetical protein